MSSWSSSWVNATEASSIARTDISGYSGDTTRLQFDASGASGFNKLQMDLMAHIEDSGGLRVNESMVRRDPLGAAQMIAKTRSSAIKNMLDGLRVADNVRVAFLVDVTGSMQPHIDGVKQQVQAICSQLTSTTCGSHIGRVAVAFVGYRDFCDGENHFEVLQFTTSLDHFRNFVGAITAWGGGDGPEDVNGALRTAVDTLAWDASAANVLFHIGDAPPHGREYSTMSSDSVSLEGMKHHDEPVVRIFQRMQQKEIQYYFGKINASTDTMIRVFESVHGQTIKVFDVSEPISTTDSVVSAASMTIVSRTIAPAASSSKRTPLPRTLTFSKTPPTWNALPLIDGEFMIYRRPSDIKRVLEYIELERTTKAAQIKVAPVPFAEGSLRLAYYAREASRDLVCKVFKPRNSTDTSARTYDQFRYMIAVEMQTIASFLARQFNAQVAHAGVASNVKIFYLETRVFAVKPSSSDAVEHQLFVVEKRLDITVNQWIKVINNAGSVMRSSSDASSPDPAVIEYLTAFAHWTFCASGEYLLVTDLQGIVTSALVDDDEAMVARNTTGSATHRAGAQATTVILTDPAVHCVASTRFGRTNLGRRGMNLFFQTHVCNRFCAALNLKTPTESYLADGSIEE